MFLSNGYTGQGAGNIYFGALELDIDEILTLEVDDTEFDISIIPENEFMTDEGFALYVDDGFALTLPDDENEMEVCI